MGWTFAFSWHPDETNSVSTESTMANYQICYHFRGVSAHAAMSPELGRSALDALELMNVGIQFLREHVPRRPVSTTPSLTPVERLRAWSSPMRGALPHACSQAVSGERAL